MTGMVVAKKKNKYATIRLSKRKRKVHGPKDKAIMNLDNGKARQVVVCDAKQRGYPSRNPRIKQR